MSSPDFSRIRSSTFASKTSSSMTSSSTSPSITSYFLTSSSSSTATATTTTTSTSDIGHREFNTASDSTGRGESPLCSVSESSKLGMAREEEQCDGKGVARSKAVNNFSLHATRGSESASFNGDGGGARGASTLCNGNHENGRITAPDTHRTDTGKHKKLQAAKSQTSGQAKAIKSTNSESSIRRKLFARGKGSVSQKNFSDDIVSPSETPDIVIGSTSVTQSLPLLRKVRSDGNEEGSMVAGKQDSKKNGGHSKLI